MIFFKAFWVKAFDILFSRMGYASRLYKEWKKKKILKHNAIIEGKAYHLKQKGYIYNLLLHRPKFYLPNYEKDYIQQKILSTGTYYEEPDLKYIMSKVEAGAIGRQIKDSGVLDIGSNIGNQTL